MICDDCMRHDGCTWAPWTGTDCPAFEASEPRSPKVEARREHLTYLASPYSPPAHLEGRMAGVVHRQVMFTAVARVAAIMMARGELLFSPIAHTHPIAMEGTLPTDWQFWQRYDTRMIASCDSVTVACLEGWRESRGVQAEIAEAERLGLPVRYVNEDGVPLKHRPLLPLSPEAREARRPPSPDRLIEPGPDTDLCSCPCDDPSWPMNGGCKDCIATARECPKI